MDEVAVMYANIEFEKSAVDNLRDARERFDKAVVEIQNAMNDVERAQQNLRNSLTVRKADVDG